MPTERIESPGGYIELSDLESEKATKSTPLFLVFGWGETVAAVRPTIDAFVEAGYRVLVADYDALDGPDPSSKKYPQIEYIKALAILKVLDEKGIKKVDIVAHSEGAISATIAGVLGSKKIRTIVYVSPASMMQQDAFHRLALRFTGYLFKQLWHYPAREKLQALVYVGGIIKYAILNPLQALRQALGIADVEMIEALKSLRGKIDIHIVHTKKDAVFPIEDVRRAAIKAKIENFYELEGGHNEMNIHPRNFVTFVDKKVLIH